MAPLPGPQFTVFTASYNRAHTLPRVYASLQAQTLRDFEWLIVDDGSTDGTAELVAGWAAEADFPIRYLVQDHGGKHKAANLGAREAHGELFLPLDSDDECRPEALERFAAHWAGIPESQRAGFSGVTALCDDQHGEIVGSRFPFDPTDSDALEIRYRYRVTGEKWGFHTTTARRQFPAPEMAGQPNVPESIIWNRISRRYRTRFVNEVLRTYHVGEDSITRESGAKVARRAPAYALRDRIVLDEDLDWFRHAPKTFLRAAANYSRFAWHEGSSFRDQQRALRSTRARALHLLAAPLGWTLRRRDLQRT
ncbi:glycosyltransferase family A protein [Actinomycetospora sp. NBC_00405]|uniref:glycosyltransferase family A protein n=1 Tax=Actinomycetospora sp. NBC_00405 TaxID=2975952 RepID=UPI002E1DD8F4